MPNGKKLIDPFILQRSNPILSTSEKNVYEDDERKWIQEENPENLKVAMDFFDPESDKYSFMRNYSAAQILGASVESKFRLYEQHRHNFIPKSDTRSQKIKGLKATVSLPSSEKIDELLKSSDQTDDSVSVSQSSTSNSQPVNKMAEDIMMAFHELKKEEKRHPRKSGIPTPYGCMCILESFEKLVCYEHALYIFRDGKFDFLNYDDALSFLMTFFEYAMSDLGTVDFLKKIYDCLQRHEKIRLKPNQINKWLIGFNNGFWDVKNKTFYDSSTQLFTPFQVNANIVFQPLSCPVFDAFLEDTSCGDQLWIERVWEILGYLLTPDNSAKAIFVFQGKMHTGKSLISELLENFFPENIRSSMGVEELEQQFGACNLLGKVICISPDLKYEAFRGSSVSWLKRISGGDTITTAVKYRPDMISFKPQTRFVLSTNHPIHLTYPDKAFMSRLVVVPFFKTIPPEQQNKELIGKILLEKDAILQKALWYAERLRNRNGVFSGHFSINIRDCFDTDDDFELPYNEKVPSNETLASFIQKFLLYNVCEVTESFLPLNTIYSAFIEKGINITVQHFSQLCSSLVSELFPSSQKTKRRVPDAPNPVNGFLGLKLKNNNLEV